ncbi:MAG TPA: dihydrofolate reductase family protein [Chloroflexota bacterium]
MNKVVWHTTMSLDGFIAGPGHAMEWVFEYPASPDALKVMHMTGAMLAGRNTYDVGVRDAGKQSGAAYGGAWSGPVFVLTHRPPDAVPDPTITFLHGDIRQAVATAGKAAGDKNLEVLGANVARQCIEAALLDEIVIHLTPILLGDGVHLFERRTGEPVRLERLTVDQSSQVTALRFRVLK